MSSQQSFLLPYCIEGRGVWIGRPVLSAVGYVRPIDYVFDYVLHSESGGFTVDHDNRRRAALIPSDPGNMPSVATSPIRTGRHMPSATTSPHWRSRISPPTRGALFIESVEDSTHAKALLAAAATFKRAAPTHRDEQTKASVARLSTQCEQRAAFVASMYVRRLARSSKCGSETV